jgi:hypothetical protein
MAYRAPKARRRRTLSELFLIKKSSVRTLLDVTSELDDCKGFPDIDFNHGLFEVMIDFE